MSLLPWKRLWYIILCMFLLTSCLFAGNHCTKSTYTVFKPVLATCVLLPRCNCLRSDLWDRIFEVRLCLHIAKICNSVSWIVQINCVSALEFEFGWAFLKCRLRPLCYRSTYLQGRRASCRTWSCSTDARNRAEAFSESSYPQGRKTFEDTELETSEQAKGLLQSASAHNRFCKTGHVVRRLSET